MKKLLALLIVQLVVLGGLNASTLAANTPQKKPTETPQLKLVVKRAFLLPSYTTVGGKVIKNVKTGWESYGVLNAKKDNVILITHYFAGSSHAAGKYAANDERPGYWDSLIGPGKPIDTNKFF